MDAIYFVNHDAFSVSVLVSQKSPGDDVQGFFYGFFPVSSGNDLSKE